MKPVGALLRICSRTANEWDIARSPQVARGPVWRGRVPMGPTHRSEGRTSSRPNAAAEVEGRIPSRPRGGAKELLTTGWLRPPGEFPRWWE
jgi:hypothetical protein